MSERYRVIENGMITRRGPGWDVHDGTRVIASAWDEADSIAVCAALNKVSSLSWMADTEKLQSALDHNVGERLKLLKEVAPLREALEQIERLDPSSSVFGREQDIARIALAREQPDD